jgi:hypothetical protein
MGAGGYGAEVGGRVSPHLAGGEYVAQRGDAGAGGMQAGPEYLPDAAPPQARAAPPPQQVRLGCGRAAARAESTRRAGRTGGVLLCGGRRRAGWCSSLGAWWGVACCAGDGRLGLAEPRRKGGGVVLAAGTAGRGAVVW